MRLGDTKDFKFTTVDAGGAPFTLAGTPVVSAYVDNGTTEITAGVTLTADFDTVTGLNNVRVVATSGNGFAEGTTVELVITTGTVDSVSVVGYKVGSFDLEDGARSRADRGVIVEGTAGAVTATTMVLPTLPATTADDDLIGAEIWVTSATAGANQRPIITNYVNATNTASFDALNTPLTGTIEVVVFASPAPSQGLLVAANTIQIEGVDATDQLQASANAALIANFLDRLFAVDYDPTLIPGVAGAWANEIMEDDGNGNMRYTAKSLENIQVLGGESVHGGFIFDSTTTSGDPGSGGVRINDVFYHLATEIYISDTTDNGIDASIRLGGLRQGDIIHITEDADGGNFGRFNVIDTPTDNGDWFTLPVSNISHGSSITNSAPVTVYLSVASSAILLNCPGLLNTATIETLASQIQFTLSSGSVDDGAYDDAIAVITSATNSSQKKVGRVATYTGATLTVDLEPDPGPSVFTIAAGDGIDIIAQGSNISLAAAAILENQFDGTGITGDTFPSTQAQVGAIGSASGGALNFEATGDNTVSPILGVSFIGVETAGTFVDTDAEDGSYHQIDDAGNAIDTVYCFSLGGSRVAGEAIFKGYLNGGNDECQIAAYDYDTLSWDNRVVLDGQAGSANITLAIKLLNKHTGNGANLGLAYLRFTCTAQSNPALFVDELLMSGVNISQSVGYQDGAVWIDTINGTAGVEPFVNGVADNPSLTSADAITVAASVGLSKFVVRANSVITFAESHDNEVWEGDNWDLNLGSQSISNAAIRGASNITGAATAVERPGFRGCGFGNVSLPPCLIDRSGFTGVLTVNAGGSYDIISGYDLAGGIPPVFDFNGAVGATLFNLEGWAGDVTFDNIGTGDVVSLQGVGGVVTFNGVDGTANVRGIFEQVIDNAGIGVTQLGNINRPSLQGYMGGEVSIDTNGSNIETVEYVDGTADKPVSTIAAARTIADSVGLTAFSLFSGSSIVLDQAYDNWRFNAVNGSVDMNGQSTDNTVFMRTVITGINAISPGALVVFELCGLIAVTTGASSMINCGLSGTITYADQRDYQMSDCINNILLGGGSLVLDAAGDGITATNIVNDRFSGDMELQNLTSTDSYKMSGEGTLTINANCIGGAIKWSGDIKVINNSTAVTVTHANIGDMREGIILGSAIAGTLSPTQATTDLTGYGVDQLAGSVIIWISGPAEGERKAITANTAGGLLTFDTLTIAPTNGDEFKIV